jgi:uncharacterized protein YbjT (DUF2867 family)
MLGQGVLRECLLAPDVEQVTTIGRSPTLSAHPKRRHIVHHDFLNFSALEGQLGGFDACFWCVGVSSVGMTESAYRRVTCEAMLAAARPLAVLNPGMTFVFVSGAGADSTERGRIMWARVKGEAENALARIPFKATYVFRPAFVQPLHGIRSRTAFYNTLYAILSPAVSLLKKAAPNYVTTTELFGKAMLAVARRGAPKRILENADINRAAA